MPITEEIINKDSVLSALNAEQKAAIIAMSANSEQAAINTKFAEVHNELDNMVKTITGINKDGGEKTSAYIERMLKDGLTKSQSYTEQITTLEAAKKELEEKLAKNGNLDEETKKALADAKRDLENVRGEYSKLNDKFKAAEAQHTADLFNFRIDGDFANAMSGFQFKEGMTDQVLAVLKQNAISQVKGMHPEYVDDGRGGKTLVFKNENGDILRNPENQLNPFTASELLKDTFTKMGILAAAGGGAGGAGGRGGNGGLGNARTQMEARNNVEQTLLARGLTRGSEAFNTELVKILNENIAAYNSLPIR